MCQEEESNKLTNLDYLANTLAEQRRKISKKWEESGILKGLTLNKDEKIEALLSSNAGYFLNEKIEKFTADGVKICPPLK